MGGLRLWSQDVPLNLGACFGLLRAGSVWTVRHLDEDKHKQSVLNWDINQVLMGLFRSTGTLVGQRINLTTNIRHRHCRKDEEVQVPGGHQDPGDTPPTHTHTVTVLVMVLPPHPPPSSPGSSSSSPPSVPPGSDPQPPGLQPAELHSEPPGTTGLSPPGGLSAAGCRPCY